MNSDLSHGFYLGELLIEPLTGRVTGPGVSEHLAPKAANVLLSLARNAGELVSRDDLLKEVWGKGKGSRESLSHAISDIRHALKDQADDPKFIQTVPRRGYRLIVAVTTTPEKLPAGILEHMKGSQLDDIGLLENIKQRGVFETALAYLIVGWLLIQVADIVFAQLHLPAWAGTFVTALVIAGFPIAVVLSWFLEFRDGHAVVHHLSQTDALRRRFSRTYISVLAALTIAAAGVYIYDKSIGLPHAPVMAFSSTGGGRFLPPVRENSIAVLPFFNVDGGEDTQIFANGLADEVTTRLSRVSGLLVSSRGDAFTLGPNPESQRVRERLRVAVYVEGSVQIEGDQMRVSVQLIDSETGFHILSRRFYRPLEDFFAMRDDITELTVANVRVALPPGTRATPRLTGDDPSLDVYVLYRRGIEASRLPKRIETINAALGWFDAALAIDPEYSAALAGKCSVYVDGYPVTDDPAFIDYAENFCAKALELNPNLDVVHAALGELYRATGRYDKAESSYLAALQIDPSNGISLTGLGTIYMLQQKSAEAEARFTQAIGMHPGDWSAFNALGFFLYRSGRYAEAAEQYEYVVALDEKNMVGYSNLGTAYMLAGDFESAAVALQKAIDIEPRQATYSSLGLMYYYRGDLEKATDSHRQATRLAPNDYLAWSNLGDALWIAGNKTEAREVFKTAESLAASKVSVNPNDAAYLMDLAWISAMLDKVDVAQGFIAKARSQAPDDPYVHYIDGLILLRSGNADAALSALELAAQKGYSRQMLAAEPHLASLRDHSRFKTVVNPAISP